jgi:O-methyltransferase
MSEARKFKWKQLPKKLFLNQPAKIKLIFPIRRIFPFSQLRFAGLCQMHDLIQLVDKNKISGSIVEMGCGRGGCGSFMADCVEKSGAKRNVWLFDSFEGLSDPAPEDFKETNKKEDEIRKGYLKVSSQLPREAMRAIGLKNPENVKVIPGWFEESLPKHLDEIGEIAILRLDADLYEPTKYCLEQMYDRVAEGGYIVIDDYKNWSGTRRALYEFFYKKNINPYIEIYPYGGVAFFKKRSDTL